jgi:hypothetical protein
MTQTEQNLSREEQLALDRVENSIKTINQLGKYRVIQFLYLIPFIIGGGVLLGIGILASGASPPRQVAMSLLVASVILGGAFYHSYKESWTLLAKSIDPNLKPYGHDCQIWYCFSLVKDLTFKNLDDVKTLRAIKIICLSKKKPQTIRNKHHNTLMDLIIEGVNTRLDDFSRSHPTEND